MKQPNIFIYEEALATPTPAKQSKIPMDVHEVLDFYKSHSEEIRSVLRTMRKTDSDHKLFMLGYYVGYSKR